MRKTLTLALVVSFAFSVAACGDDDSVGGNNNTVNCTDLDGDGYGVGADCIGPDCNDQDDHCIFDGDACCDGTTCTDLDGDGYGVGTTCLGADCDDNNAQCWTGACCNAGDCTDLDGDGYGNGTTCLGADCNDNDNQCWAGACCQAGTCTDNDGDGYGYGSDCAGPDCDDTNNQCHTPGDACCPVSAGTTGEPCTDATSCTNITNGTPECLTSVVVINFPNGYCTGSSCTAGQACDTSGGICVELYQGYSYCLLACSTPSECRVSEGYDCSTIPYSSDTNTYCLPSQGGP